MVGEGTCDNFPVKLRLDLVGRLLQRLMAPISFPINLYLCDIAKCVQQSMKYKSATVREITKRKLLKLICLMGGGG